MSQSYAYSIPGIEGCNRSRLICNMTIRQLAILRIFILTTGTSIIINLMRSMGPSPGPLHRHALQHHVHAELGFALLAGSFVRLVGKIYKDFPK